MKEIRQYYDALKKKGTTRTSDLPYGKKQAAWTVTFLVPVIDTTEGFYKMIVPAMAMNKYNFSIRCIIINMELYDPVKSINYYSPELKQGLIKETDFMVFPFVSYPLEPVIAEIKKYNPNIKIGYHVDFNYYLVPDSYPFSNLYNNQEAHTIIEKNMRAVDRVFVSNKNLVNAIYEKTDEKYKKGYINNIVYQPLMFNKDYLNIGESDKKEKPMKYRIGIIASSMHLTDINYIKGVLVDILKKHGDDAELFIIGFDGVHKGKNYLKNIDFTYIPRISIFEYYQRIKDLSLNMALMPAKNNMFNRTSKNYIKYMEFAQLNIPVIMSNVIQDVIPDKHRPQHNGTALVCKEKENWTYELELDIVGSDEPETVDKVEQIIYAAYESVENFNILLPDNLKYIEELYTFKNPEQKRIKQTK